jgi:hypothetical protein
MTYGYGFDPLYLLLVLPPLLLGFWAQAKVRLTPNTRVEPAGLTGGCR